MITLEVHRPHWIKDEGDDPSDQCAHGFVEFRIGDVCLSTVEAGEWTVSAAALFLMRTVFSDHDPENSVADANFLIPCCGHTIYPDPDGSRPYSIQGCCDGVDPTVRHIGDDVEISLGEDSVQVRLTAWADAVLGFAVKVKGFYDSSAPKWPLEPDDFQKPGWEYFWEHWGELERDIRELLASDA